MSTLQDLDLLSWAQRQLREARERYEAESRRAAAELLGARRNVQWAVALLVAVFAAGSVVLLLDPVQQSWPASICRWLFAIVAIVLGSQMLRMFTAQRWLMSLRRQAGLPNISPDVSSTTFARSVLDGSDAVEEL